MEESYKFEVKKKRYNTLLHLVHTIWMAPEPKSKWTGDGYSQSPVDENADVI